MNLLGVYSIVLYLLVGIIADTLFGYWGAFFAAVLFIGCAWYYQQKR